MKRNRLMSLTFTVLLLLVMSIPAAADMGPKPSVVVDFSGLLEGECWATLMAPTYTTGPHWSVIRENDDGQRVQREGAHRRIEQGDTRQRVWEAFHALELRDPELYFLQVYAEVTGGAGYRWGYYPPEEFKIAIYFPETDAMAITDVFYGQYAFDSYYAVDLSGVQLVPGETVTGVEAVVSYDYSKEPVGLLARVVLTVAVELAVAAWPFQLREKNRRRLILCVNVVTQFLLNLALSVYVYYKGPVSMLVYALFELVVFFVEAAVYYRKLSDKPDFELAAGYSFAANLASLGLGGVLSKLLPGLF